MTERETIEIAIHCLNVQAEREVCEECPVYAEGGIACREVARTAIAALEEIRLYRDNRLCLIPEDVYSRQCCELDAYKELGTVEECQESREKQKPKKCVEDSCPDHTHYKCPSCGKIQKTKYDDSTFGCILNYCSNCGQALMDENLEGMEDE